MLDHSKWIVQVDKTNRFVEIRGFNVENKKHEHVTRSAKSCELLAPDVMQYKSTKEDGIKERGICREYWNLLGICSEYEFVRLQGARH